MKKFSMMIAGLAIATAAFPAAASAQNWEAINQRQASLDQRIDQGVRSGALNRAEATRMRSQFREIAARESQYRRSGGGLSIGERRDLDQRFDTLSKRVRVQKNDRQGR